MILSNEAAIKQNHIKSFASKTRHIKSLSKNFGDSFYGNALFSELNRINKLISESNSKDTGENQDYSKILKEIKKSLGYSKDNVRELFQE